MDRSILTLLPRVGKAGGALGVITALIAFYIGVVDLLAADNVKLPVGNLN